MDGGPCCDTEGGGGRDGTATVAELIISELGSHGSLQATAESIVDVNFLLLVVVAVVTVDNKVEGGVEVLKGKLLVLASRMPMVTDYNLSSHMYSDALHTHTHTHSRMHTHTHAHTHTHTHTRNTHTHTCVWVRIYIHTHTRDFTCTTNKYILYLSDIQRVNLPLVFFAITFRLSCNFCLVSSTVSYSGA